MKGSLIAIMTVALLALSSTNGISGQRELHGMLIGAGSGAILGHVIGGNAQAAIIGSAIGSAVGVTVAGVHRHGLPLPPPPFFVPPPFPPHPQVVRHYDRRYGDHRPQCRIVETTYYKYGRPHIVAERVCQEGRSYYRGNDRHYRDYPRDRRSRIDRPWNRHYNN